MQIYVLIFIVALVLALLELGMDRKFVPYRNLHFYLFAVLALFLFLVAGFRECGFDYESYNGYFEELNSPNWFARGMAIGSEPGYSFLNYAIGNYAAVIAVMSAAIIWVQFRFIYKYSALPIFAILFYLGIYMYSSTMGQYRQALAMGIVLWAIAKKENKKQFFLLIAVAMMFHFSAIMGILALFVPEKTYKTKVYIWLFLGALLCSVTAQTIYLNFISSLPPYVATKLAHYAATESTPLGLNTAVLIRAFVFFTCYYFRDKLSQIRLMPYFMNIYFLSLIIYTALGFAPQVAGRGSLYFSFFEIILVSNLVFALKGWTRTLFLFIFVLFSVFRQLQFFDAWTGNYIPYSNWFFDLF